MAFKFDYLNLKKKEKGPKIPTKKINIKGNYGVHEKLKLEKYSGYEEFIHEKLGDFLDTYEKEKKLLHDGGTMGLIYELPYDNRNLIIKELRENPRNTIINSPEKEMEIQDEVYSLGIQTPIPVSYIEITHVDKSKEIGKRLTEKKLVVMEKINGASVGDYLRKIQRGSSAVLPENFSLDSFMEKLTSLIEELHKNNYYHRDLTVNNVMIDENGDPYLIDFGSAVKSELSDPYDFSIGMVRINGVLQEARNIRLKDDYDGLRDIKATLREIMKS